MLHRDRRRFLFVLCGVVATAIVGDACAAAPLTPFTPFALRDGDRVVVVGDSNTVSGHYVRYLETFVRTRFPQWTTTFRNAGVNGQTATGGLEIIDADVLVWKPTVVIVNYGMNDGRRGEGVEVYRTGITRYVDRLQAA